MTDPMHQIADAVEVKQDVQSLRAEVSALTAVVQSNLAEQQRLNTRIDGTVNQLTRGLQDTRERLVAVEQAVCEIPGLKESVTTLRTNVARYVGVASGMAIVISTVITVIIKIWG